MLVAIGYTGVAMTAPGGGMQGIAGSGNDEGAGATIDTTTDGPVLWWHGGIGGGGGSDVGCTHAGSDGVPARRGGRRTDGEAGASRRLGVVD